MLCLTNLYPSSYIGSIMTSLSFLSCATLLIVLHWCAKFCTCVTVILSIGSPISSSIRSLNSWFMKYVLCPFGNA